MPQQKIGEFDPQNEEELNVLLAGLSNALQASGLGAIAIGKEDALYYLRSICPCEECARRREEEETLG